MNAIVDIASSRARIDCLRTAVHEAGYSLCLERPELLLAFSKTRAAKRLKKAHVYERRAGWLSYLMANRKPRIYAHELVFGNMTSKRVASHYYPEGTSINIVEDIFRLEKRVVPLKMTVLEKVRLVYLAAATARESILLPAMVRHPSRLHRIYEMTHAKRYIVTEQAGIAHQICNHEKIIREGLVASDALAAACLQADRTPEGASLDSDQRAFYRSIRTIAGGIRAMAENLAAEAERLAADPDITATRREELLAGAVRLRHVPWQPARDFREALQAAWIIHLAMCLEDFEQGMSFGRLDQALFPLYEKDVAAGKLTYAEAVEFTASFQLKCCETMPVYSSRMDHYFSGNDVAQGLTLGGVDATGNDATNAVSGIMLDAYAMLATREPSLHVRVHAHTPDWFLEKCIHTLQATGARPAFFGDQSIIKAMQNAGYSEAHARDYGVIGCTELASQGRTHNSADAALFNLPLCLELALNEGRTFAGKKYGVRTPPVSQMQSMVDVVAAFRRQVDDSVGDMAQVMGYLEKAIREHRTTPVNSLLTAGCLQRGRDVTWGGADYNFTGVQAVGLADTGDALYAINRLVFEEGRYTLQQLVDILRHDFAGHDILAVEIRKKFPRYGNGESRVDDWTQVAADAWVDAVSKRRNSRGGQWIAGFYSMTCGYAFGRYTGAMANGRRAGARLSNGCSPADGADRKGPSALLRSVADLDKSRWCNSQVLNVTFDRKTIGGQAGAAKLADLLRTYFIDQDGMQVQVAVLNADDLRKARENPADYPNLLVRVSGYCAYFADLQPEVQDEIIARTLHG